MDVFSFSSALVVEDDVSVAGVIAHFLAQVGASQVTVATSVAEALTLLRIDLDLIVCDLCMGAEDGALVFERARTLGCTAKLVAMSGAASRAQVFELAALGVGAFLDKPFTMDEFVDCLGRAQDAAGPLTQVATQLLGRCGAREAQQLVRQTMFREALSRTAGNRHAAARLLQVDRRVVQLMAAELESPDDSLEG